MNQKCLPSTLRMDEILNEPCTRAFTDWCIDEEVQARRRKEFGDGLPRSRCVRSVEANSGKTMSK